MYFIPQKNKWYSRVVHTRPLYRYGILFLITGILFFGWRYGLYTWLDVAITQEQAAIMQLQQQLSQQSQAERHSKGLAQQLPILQQSFSQVATQCVGNTCYDQCSYLFEQTRKAGLRVTGYHAEKDKKKKSWKESQFITLALNGSLDQMQGFLTSLKKSNHMIQCPSLSLQRAEGDNFSIGCTIQFITPLV